MSPPRKEKSIYLSLWRFQGLWVFQVWVQLPLMLCGIYGIPSQYCLLPPIANVSAAFTCLSCDHRCTDCLCVLYSTTVCKCVRQQHLCNQWLNSGHISNQCICTDCLCVRYSPADCKCVLGRCKITDGSAHICNPWLNSGHMRNQHICGDM